VVRVVFDPRATSFAALLRLFWEGHDPTQEMRQDDAGATRHRSVIFCASDAQRREALASRDTYQRALSAAGFGTVTTEIVEAPEFHCAEDAHQQSLAKHPGGYAGLSGTGVPYPA
jgi:peptide-methionine (S)-S-oxide reductase